MSKIIPINSKIISESSNSITTIINSNNNNFFPITTTEEENINLEINNKGTIIPINLKNNNLNTSVNINNEPTPIINENEIYLEMNGVGPMGPPGLTGNGIERIEKTSTSGIVDTYTIYFTNGNSFNYEIINGVVYYYDGEYEVTPMPYTSQILNTQNLVMRENINIQEIPYYEVSNLSGGKTATIGDLNG